MAIEIENPELEAILQQRMTSGRFANLEAMLLSWAQQVIVPAEVQAPKSGPEEIDELFALFDSTPIGSNISEEALHRKNWYR